jgi:hypothetical protein
MFHLLELSKNLQFRVLLRVFTGEQSFLNSVIVNYNTIELASPFWGVFVCVSAGFQAAVAIRRQAIAYTVLKLTMASRIY